MEVNLLDKMLADYQDRKTAVTIVLQNRARVSGAIKSFDSYVIILENSRSEIVYRHAVSSLSPAAAVARPAVAAAPRPAARPQEQPRQAVKEDKRPAARSAKPKQPKPQPRPAAPSAEQSLNTGMQEGLQRWLQGQKAK